MTCNPGHILLFIRLHLCSAVLIMCRSFSNLSGSDVEAYGGFMAHVGTGLPSLGIVGHLSGMLTLAQNPPLTKPLTFLPWCSHCRELWCYSISFLPLLVISICPTLPVMPDFLATGCPLWHCWPAPGNVVCVYIFHDSTDCTLQWDV